MLKALERAMRNRVVISVASAVVSVAATSIATEAPAVYAAICTPAP